VVVGSKQWGFVIYRSSEEAVAAVEGTKDDASEVAQLETRRAARHNSDFRAKLSWNRRRGKGFGFVKVGNVWHCFTGVHATHAGDFLVLGWSSKSRRTLADQSYAIIIPL
jgi:hypothetical protein